MSMAYYILKSYKLKDILTSHIFEILGKEKNFFCLDSSLTADSSLGRYTFFGAEPFHILKTKKQDPFPELREILNKYQIDCSCRFPFAAGAVGYLTYDLGLFLEKKIKAKNKDALDIPDCLFAFYNTIVIIDHLKGLLYIFSVGFPEKNSRAAKLLACSNLKKTQSLLTKIELNHAYKKTAKSTDNPVRLNSDFTKEEYISAIKKAKEYIKAGDIYQVNLSQRFNAKSFLPAVEIYRRLRSISPSYFSAYFDAGEFQIISSSPERFIRLEGDTVTTRPMKGTRPRSKNKKEDRMLKKELMLSEKDKAELVMIVDLERNDLGRVCSYDSIKVDNLRELEEYNTVFQTTATVSGRLHKDKDRIDLLRACFPGGSITGCPKIRAMEIIEELEPVRRSIYTGGLGYLSFSGNMDLNILIRTMLKKDHKVSFGVGGGIVADSNPEKEYEETLVKAKAMFEAIGAF